MNNRVNFLVYLLVGVMSVSTIWAQTYTPRFCGFSIAEGYEYEEEKDREFIAEKVSVGHSSGIADVVDEILRKIKINTEIEVFLVGNEGNCYATVLEESRRVIVADHHFLQKVNDTAGTQWAAISILAHEIGHHINGFSQKVSRRQSEMEADYWSGYMLQKLGANKKAALQCIMVFGEEKDGFYYPNKYTRAGAITEGWEDANRGKTPKFNPN
jgi:hypothetical protein